MCGAVVFLTRQLTTRTVLCCKKFALRFTDCCRARQSNVRCDRIKI